MAVDQDEGDVGPQQRPERVDATLRLLLAAGFLFEPLARVVVPDEPQRVEGPRLGGLGVALVLQLDREGIGCRRKAGELRHPRVVLHAQVVLAQAVALAGVIGDNVEQAFLEECLLLRRPVERRDQDGLAAAAPTEDGDVLFPHSNIRCHGTDGSIRASLLRDTGSRSPPRPYSNSTPAGAPQPPNPIPPARPDTSAGSAQPRPPPRLASSRSPSGSGFEHGHHYRLGPASSRFSESMLADRHHARLPDHPGHRARTKGS